ncbi:MAG: dTMP kinase [Acidobacteria bacterium]|nr:dTMP kinase [Acidobacteriota bacterium]
MARGWFITFEGGEGTGKSTQIELLRQYLVERGWTVLVSREPGGTPLAEKIRELLLDPHYDPDPLTELFLLEASRREHVERVIRPAIERGEVVICDRFADSSTVYQGLAGGVPAKTVALLNEAATSGLVPDRTLVLDLHVEEGLERAHRRNRDRGGASRIDDSPPAFHRRVRDGFLELARREPERVRVVDALGSPDEVFARVLAELPEALR